MANVAHSSLTGGDLHEPKGIGAASASTVYVADGAGSGSWSSATTLLSLAGMIADFATPIAPSGWLECDGSAISRSSFSTLFSAVTISGNGTRTSASAVITGISSTTNMKVGYYVSGTGLTANSTIVSVDSVNQITISAAAASSGTSTVVVSPWQLGDGSTTFNLPSMAKRFRRSRSNADSVFMGALQAEAINSHTHGVSYSGNTGVDTQTHTHEWGNTTSAQSVDHHHSGTTGSENQDHTHAGGGLFDAAQSPAAFLASGTGQTAVTVVNNTGSAITGGVNGNHDHNFTTGGISASHTHTVSGTTGTPNSQHTHPVSISVTSAANGSAGTETRPISVVVMTCVKT